MHIKTSHLEKPISNIVFIFVKSLVKAYKIHYHSLTCARSLLNPRVLKTYLSPMKSFKCLLKKLSVIIPISNILLPPQKFLLPPHLPPLNLIFKTSFSFRRLPLPNLSNTKTSSVPSTSLSLPLPKQPLQTSPYTPPLSLLSQLLPISLAQL